ncbi:MAG: hypothetical protein ABS81_02795 [Pseudonocardia sp. SCN 72-86]|nr:MAG: hypothetical protein ABS81_02795 [Pseudonocardia sp. SCN 72-86]
MPDLKEETMRTLSTFTRRRTRSALAIVAAGLLCITAACGSGAPDPASTAPQSSIDPNEGGGAEWQKVVDAANKEGSVVLYLSPPGVEERLKQAFAANYPGIKLTTLRQGTGELTTRLDQERTTSAAGADVTLHSSKAWFDKNVDSLAVSTGPALGKYWSAGNLLPPSKTYAPVASSTWGLGINTELFKELGAKPITSYADLLQPELKGAIGIAPAGNSPASTQWWFFAAPHLGDAAGLRTLASLNVTPYPGGSAPLAEALASGEKAVGVYESTLTVGSLVKSGAPIEIVDLQPPIAIAYFSGAVKWASHPNAALVFQNWLMSPAGQVALNGSGELYTALSLDSLGPVPPTMRTLDPNASLTDGIVTPEQQKWLDETWKPIMGG